MNFVFYIRNYTLETFLNKFYNFSSFYQIHLSVFIDDLVAVAAIVVLGVAVAVVETRDLVDDDRLAVFQTQAFRQRLQQKAATSSHRVSDRGTTVNVEADVALAYGRSRGAQERAVSDVVEVVAGVQLLDHVLQDVEIVGSRSQRFAHDHALDTVVVVEELDGRVGDDDLPPVHDVSVLHVDIVALGLPEAAN